MNQSRAICSVATEAYLPKAILLYQSILRYQDLPLYLLAPDLDPDGKATLTRKLERFLAQSLVEKIHVIVPHEIYGDDVAQMRFYYDAFEFSVACKAGLHAWMQRRAPVGSWLYLDADMLCFGSLDALFTRLESHSILLTPHSSSAIHSLNTNLLFLSAGTFNSGVSGLKRSPESEAFTNWSLNVLRFLCLNDLALPPQERFTHSTVLFVDQRWLDLVPAYFRKVIVVPERGYNLGHWNVGHDRLNWRGQSLHIGEDPVVLLHLSGWQENDPGRLSRHSSLDWSNDPVWEGIHTEYRAALLPLQEYFDAPYPFNAYADGTAITKAHRRQYLQHLLRGGAKAEDPFRGPPLQAA